MGVIKSLMAGAVGAAVAFLFDPQNGHGRRARLADMTFARTRRAGEELGRRGRYEAGRARGLMHSLTRGEADHPQDDAELLQKVRSEALGPSGYPQDQLELVVREGVVEVRGRRAHEEAAVDLIRRISAVTGVERVEDRLTEDH